ALAIAIGRAGERPTEIEVRVTETSSPQEVRSGKTKRKAKEKVRATVRPAPLSARFSPTVFARPYWLAYLPLAVLAVLAVVFLNVNVVRADVSYKQGLGYDMAKRWDKSVEFYQVAIDLVPDQDYYYLFMGRAYMDWAQSMSDQPNKVSLLQRSEKALLAAQQASPLNTDHYANLGRLYKYWNSATGEVSYLDKSEKYYREATKLSPHNAAIADELATVYLSKGKFKEAEDELNRSLGLDQQYANTYVVLGDAFRMTNDPKQAAQNYAKAIAVDPQSPLADSNFDVRFTYVLSSGQVAALIDAYKMVTTQQPDSVAAHSTLGYLYSKNGDIREAVPQFERAAALAPTDFNSRRNLALAYRDAKLIDKALSEAEAALTLAPPDQAPGIQSLINELQKTKS
ncbi:MAG: tetratricopeptide repeat protein, partial [Chloroflexi bacterium]|nr:tetratricopeptide repeat protein [Chloroflexota bacterium]